MNKKELPLILLTDIEVVIKNATHNKAIYADMVNMELVDCNITFRDKDKNSNFYFSLTNPNLSTDSKSYYNLTLLPHTIKSVKEYSENIEVKQIDNFFKHWIGMLTKYNSINLS